MRRALTVIIAFHWTAMLGVAGAAQIRAGMIGISGDLMEVAASTAAAAVQILAALAFFWALVSVLMHSDRESAGQGDVCRIAIGTGLLATTVPALANFGDLAGLQGYVLQFAALLVSHLIMQSERPAVRSRISANDNDRAAARLLAMLAATDAKISRMARGAGHGEHLR